MARTPRLRFSDRVRVRVSDRVKVRVGRWLEIGAHTSALSVAEKAASPV